MAKVAKAALIDAQTTVAKANKEMLDSVKSTVDAAIAALNTAKVELAQVREDYPLGDSPTPGRTNLEAWFQQFSSFLDQSTNISAQLNSAATMYAPPTA